MDNAIEPDVGQGPYGIEHSEADGAYHLTREGERTGKWYPLGKTAYRAARKLNEGEQDGGSFPKIKEEVATLARFMEDDEGHGDIDTAVRRDRKENRKADEQEKLPKAAREANKRGKLRKESKEHLPDPKRAKAGPKPIAKPKPASKAEKGEAGHSAVIFSGTREEWLNAFTARARPEFLKRGFELPEKVHASVGFMFRSPKAIGQCWRPEASADGVSQIFINPIVTGSNAWLWAGIMTHELCHAGTPGDKHGPKFKQWAKGVGLEGKATQAVDGVAFREWASAILEELGPIPHSAIDPGQSGVKKQTTRLLKCECDTCGFIFRATAKHVNGKTLRCPDDDCIGDVKVEGAEGGEEE